jgi:osmotically-inducible protein OsmY
MIAFTTTVGNTKAQNQPSDEEIMRMAEEIRKGIVRLPNYAVFDNISFGIRGNTVILQGYASRPTLKDSAERVAQRVKGVEEVLNNIEVLPNSSFDDELRANVYVNIYGHPSLSRLNPNRGTPLFQSLIRREFGITNDPPPGNHPIHIIVKNGNVTLEGAVSTAAQKTIAGIQANSTAGVFSVTNDLVVLDEVEQ